MKLGPKEVYGLGPDSLANSIRNSIDYGTPIYWPWRCIRLPKRKGDRGKQYGACNMVTCEVRRIIPGNNYLACLEKLNDAYWEAQ